MTYVAAGVAALVLIGGVLFLLGRGAERRERRGRHRRGIVAGGSADAATIDGASAGDAGCDPGGGGD